MTEPGESFITADENQRALRALVSISSVISEAALDLPRLLRAIVDRVVELVGDSAAIRLFDEGCTQVVETVVRHTDPAAQAVLEQLAAGSPPPAGATATVMKTGKSVLIPVVDPSTYADSLGVEARTYAARHPVHSLMAVPLCSHGTLIGALVATRDRAGRPFGARDAELLREIADRTALAISAARSHVALVHERQRLAASERQLHDITDALPALIAFVDRDRRYRFVNRAYEVFFGRDRTQILGTTPDELARSVGVTQVDERVSRALAGEAVTFDAIAHGPGGAARTINASYIPQRAIDGTITGYVTLAQDVTEQKRAADRAAFLVEASALLASSLDYVDTLKAVAALAVPSLADWCAVEMKTETGTEQVAVAHVDPAKVAYAWELRQRWPPDPAAPTGVPAVLATGKSELYEEIPDELLAASVKDPEQLQMLRALGLRSLLVVPIKSQRGPIGAITLVTSESERRLGPADVTLAGELAARAALAIENALLYTRAQEAVRQRDDFLSVASHELKTPLTSLQLTVSGLHRAIESGRFVGLSRDKQLHRLARADVQVQRLTTLIDDLLDVSRITAGRLALRLESVDLAEVAADIVARFRESAERSGSVIAVAAEPCVGHWDRNRIDQILSNLLSNAIKYGAGEPVNVTVTTDGTTARLVVRDRGPGIASEYHTRIFERFERVPTTAGLSGIGLGLWIVSQVVDAHGGRIQVNSPSGGGAEFVVELPLGDPAGEDEP